MSSPRANALPPPPPSRPLIVLEPSQSRLARLAQPLGCEFDPAHRAQSIARGDLGQIALGEAAFQQFGEEMRKAADVFEADRLRAAEKIRADADVIDSGGFHEIDDMVGYVGERRARRGALARLQFRHLRLRIASERRLGGTV